MKRFTKSTRDLWSLMKTGPGMWSAKARKRSWLSRSSCSALLRSIMVENIPATVAKNPLSSSSIGFSILEAILMTPISSPSDPSMGQKMSEWIPRSLARVILSSLSLVCAISCVNIGSFVRAVLATRKLGSSILTSSGVPPGSIPTEATSLRVSLSSATRRIVPRSNFNDSVSPSSTL